ncbi:MAG: Response regulator containing a CheY-like receiver domain and an DNA-binding domain [Rhodospirillales bacterium]|nr:Response regulator containing a CheY-like receiver domain and an DNA-binding domain [Rhodospirillales bacterium]
MSKRLLIADDHPLYREAVRGQVERLVPGAVIDEAASLDEALAFEGRYDLVLVDFQMPGMSIDAGVPLLVSTFPDASVAMMSGVARPREVRAALKAGARGFLPKTLPAAALAAALEILIAGGTYVPLETVLDEEGPEPSIPQVPLRAVPSWMEALSPRDRRILIALGGGLTNKEIARQLELAEVTIKVNLQQIFRKVGARTRSEAAVIAVRAGLLGD